MRGTVQVPNSPGPSWPGPGAGASGELRAGATEPRKQRAALLRGNRIGSKLVRKHVVRYLRGFPGAAIMRRRLFETETAEEMLAELARLQDEYLDDDRAGGAA